MLDKKRKGGIISEVARTRAIFPEAKPILKLDNDFPKKGEVFSSGIDTKDMGTKPLKKIILSERTESVGFTRKEPLRDKINEVFTQEKPKSKYGRGNEKNLSICIKTRDQPDRLKVSSKSFLETTKIRRPERSENAGSSPLSTPKSQPTVRNSEVIEKSKEAASESIIMTQDEEKLYGKRFVSGYERLKLLGRGGQALVWLARRVSDLKLFAIKQIVLNGFISEKVALKEVELSGEIFTNEQSTDPLIGIGKNSLVRVFDYKATQKDVFLVIELAGSCLSKLVYSMKGEFLKSERVYGVISFKQ